MFTTISPPPQIVGPIAAATSLASAPSSLVAAVVPTQLQGLVQTNKAAEPVPSVTISTKSTSQTLRDFRKARPGSNPAVATEQKLVNALGVAPRAQPPTVQKVTLLSSSGLSQFLLAIPSHGHATSLKLN
jgi:hypothetical protein